MPKKPNVLVLCYGNVNRSPLFEAVLRKRGYPVKSAGFYKEMGKRAAKKTRDFAKGEGYDLTEHRSQAITLDMVKWADCIICVGISVQYRLEEFTAISRNIITLDIPDPGFLSGSSEKFTAIQSAVIRAAEAFNE